MMARLSAPPSGKPMNAFIRMSSRFFSDQPSSMAPEEKKNAWYGTTQAPMSEIA